MNGNPENVDNQPPCPRAEHQDSYNPHDPKTQLWALLLLASAQDGQAFTRLVEPAQRALMVTAYEKALSALHPSSIED
jgi:hypothetical protein